MLNKEILSIFSEWTDEFNAMLMRNNSLCVAIFSEDKKLLFANNSMNGFFVDDPHESFINPAFDKLLLLDNSVPLIFDGFLTLGDYNSVNTSIWAQIYRKNGKLLILGAVNSTQLLEQNLTMHRLNSEISNLQRQLIKEKRSLENTLIQLNEANLELKKINTDKDRFITILAHDLKSPFSSILGFLKLLIKNIRKYDIDKIENQINTIQSTAQNTYNLLEDILMWARSQTGKVAFEPQSLIFTEISENIVEGLKNVANSKNIAINCFTADEVEFLADLNMIKTILRNLVSNAIKFTHSGGVVSVYAEKGINEVIFTVSDNGIGIAPDESVKLFDITQTFTTKGTVGEKGTGLGLQLCKEFVEKHGGKIWVESELGIGSDFKFTLPLVIN
jgi:two-component system sensor histidine kinase/response regulator